MSSLFEFLIDCFAWGTSSKQEQRSMWGCLFAVLGAFTLVMAAGMALMWYLLMP